jgi:multimeric flavodoxin WrbA
MSHDKKVTAIVGTYRKNHMIDTAVDEILDSVKQEGFETNKIYLIDKHIEFCKNCRTCTQMDGREPGKCCIDDDMASILAEIEKSDAIVLGSPINFGTVTAVMKKFVERLVCFAYWPWGMNAPKVRNKKKIKRAVVVVSSAAPSLLVRLTTRTTSLLKKTAGLMGARTVGVLFIGLASREEKQSVPERIREKARSLGKKLVA